MEQDFPLFPPSASTISDRVDALFAYLTGVSGFFALLICALVVVFASKYRRRKRGALATHLHGSLPLEIVWTLIPLGIAMSFFAWGSLLYFDTVRPPAGAMEVTVVGKQWMWKLQHPDGVGEIDHLHVPVGQPVKLTMASQDVIHSFYVPAFRIKRDVVPGRYSTAWFEATKVGDYHLFCAEYCGTRHSHMRGLIHVMERSDYEDWLAAAPRGQPPAEAGARLFEALGCGACHSPDSGPRGPDLSGLLGSRVQLEDGGSLVADEEYVRESILRPNERVVRGFAPVMPTYAGQLDEEQVLELIAYIRSLGDEPGGER